MCTCVGLSSAHCWPMPAPMEMATKYAVNATGSTMKQNTPPAFVRRATSLMRINPMNTMAQPSHWYRAFSP